MGKYRKDLGQFIKITTKLRKPSGDYFGTVYRVMVMSMTKRLLVSSNPLPNQVLLLLSHCSSLRSCFSGLCSSQLNRPVGLDSPLGLLDRRDTGNSILEQSSQPRNTQYGMYHILPSEGRAYSHA